MAEEDVVFYIQSFGISTLGMVDKEGAMHACAQAGSTPFTGLKDAVNRPNRVYTDADWEALKIAEVLQKNTGVNVEIIDISQSFVQRLKLLSKGGIRTPQFVINGEKMPSITSVDQLASYLQ